LVDTVREQFEACWDKELKERSTVSEVLQTLLALDELDEQVRFPWWQMTGLTFD
jgi:hypothetical protein